jgi:hypothetical protein
MIEAKVVAGKVNSEVLRVIKSQTNEPLSLISKKITNRDTILWSPYPRHYADSLPGLVAAIQSLIDMGITFEIRQVWEDGTFRLVDIGFMENLIESRRITDSEDEEYIQHLVEAGSEDVAA